MRSQTQLPAFVAMLAVLSLPAGAQNVLVVDQAGGPGSDFINVLDAAAAAVDGDIILIRSGDYFGSPFSPPFEIDSKSLVLIADAGADVILNTDSTPLVTNLSADQTYAMRGFTVSQSAVRGLDNLGTLWIEDIKADTESMEIDVTSKVFVNNCSAAVFNRCSLRGQDAGFPSIALAGLFASNSSVHLYDTELTGGIGNFGPSTSPGAPAASLIDSFLYGSACSFILGPGLPSPAGDLLQSGATAQSILLDSTGSVDLQGGSSSTLAGVSRSFEINSPVREGEILSISFGGPPGEIAILNLGLKPTGLFFDQLAGSALIDLPVFFIRIMGIIPASGTLVKNLTLNELGAGIEGVSFYSQGSFASAEGIVVGGGSLVVLLDDSL